MPSFDYVVVIDCPNHKVTRVHCISEQEANSLADTWRRRGCAATVEIEADFPLDPPKG